MPRQAAISRVRERVLADTLDARAARRFLPASLVGAAVLALSGCGGSAKITKAQYVQKVNAICTTEKQQMTQVALSSTKINEKISEAIQLREQTQAKIEAVKTPANEAISPEWLRQRELALAATKKIAAARPGTREARLQEAAYIRATNAAQRLGLAYGLTACRGFGAT